MHNDERGRAFYHSSSSTSSTRGAAWADGILFVSPASSPLPVGGGADEAPVVVAVEVAVPFVFAFAFALALASSATAFFFDLDLPFVLPEPSGFDFLPFLGLSCNSQNRND